MADVTRDEFTALTTRVARLEQGTPTPPVTPPVVTPPVAKAIDLATPLVTVSDNRYTVTGVVNVSVPVSFVYLQLAVRGPGAKDLALSPNTRMKAGESKTLTGGSAGQAGSYTAYLAYSKDGKTWVDGPKAAFTLDTGSAPAGGSTTAAAVNGGGAKSGLPFPSIVFRAYPREAEDFGTRRGTPVDGLLTFTGRDSWNDFRWVPDGTADYVASGHLVVTSMPHAPQSEGDGMNQKGANDGYRDQQRDLGAYLAGQGLNSPLYYIRIDWECNGNWYPWSANRGGGADALREAIKNYVNNVRAGGLTKVKFDLCFNKGPSQAGHDFDIFPGAEWIDDIGVDQYDMWGPSYNGSDWDRENAKVPSIRGAAAFAKEHGITWSWDEGGNTHGDSNQGGDNPTYWQLVHQEIMDNLDNCAWHNTYDNAGAPASLAHDFNQNPKSWPVYKQLWSPR